MTDSNPRSAHRRLITQYDVHERLRQESLKEMTGLVSLFVGVLVAMGIVKRARVMVLSEVGVVLYDGRLNISEVDQLVVTENMGSDFHMLMRVRESPFHTNSHAQEVEIDWTAVRSPAALTVGVMRA